MGPIEIIVIVLVAALLVFSIVYNVRKKKKGGNCSSCPYADGCTSRKQKEKDDKKK